MSGPRPKVLHLPKVRMLARGARLASGIRITNVKSIRPVDLEASKKLDEDQLRVQLQKEIASRARSCAYTGYECWSPVVAGRRHCAAHVLADPSAPYVQCSHVYGNGERCPQPAPRQEQQRDGKEPQCFEHARACLLARQRSAAPPPPVISSETLLTRLQHYVKAERPRTTSCASSVSVVSDPEPEQAENLPVDPFKQMDATSINAAHSLSILECCSGSDSEGESVTLGPGGTCRHQVEASDTEDAPTEATPLWRAGVFTAEEAVSETKASLRSLQAAYLKQMSRLRSLLLTARLQYVRSLKQEREQYCSINSQTRSGGVSARERRQLRALKAYAGYRRRHGPDAVLARKLHHRRAKVNDPPAARAPPSLARCTFSEGGVRCVLHSLPAARHCLKHILQDQHQVLFAACGDPRGLSPCREPVPPLPAPPRACRYHASPPAYTVFTLKKDESGSETDTDTALTSGSGAESELPAPTLDTLHTLDTLDVAYT